METVKKVVRKRKTVKKGEKEEKVEKEEKGKFTMVVERREVVIQWP